MSFNLKATLARARPDRKGYEKLSYDQHVERLKSMKPTVDNAPPRPHPLSNKRELEKVSDSVITMSYILLIFVLFFL